MPRFAPLLALALFACKGPDEGPGEFTLSAAPASVDVGTILVGATSTADVVITNDGPDAAEATLDLSGAGLAAWSVSPGSLDLAAGDSTTVTVTFAPTAGGDFPALLSAAELEIPLMGRGDADADGDGFISVETGGDDCDDADPDVFPGAEDAWYDGVDGDCAGNDDFDQDADGASRDVHDCDDTDATVHPGADDAWYDGVDADCAEDDDYDQDGDGHSLGPDCDDLDPTVNPDAVETWYDGVDSDCDGADDYDQDDDGFAAGDDCDDTDPLAHPGAIEIPDDIDNDCSGAPDDLPIERAARGVAWGTADAMGIGTRGGASHGDVDGDGAIDLIVVSPALDDGYGFVVPAADLVGYTGPIEDIATATFSGPGGIVPGSFGGPMGDPTGDGTADLLVAGTSGSGGRAWLIAGGAGVVGALDLLAADASFDSGAATQLEVATTGDVDGDGIDDVVGGYRMPDTGTVAIWLGDVSGAYTSDDADASFTGMTAGDALGSAISVIDVDADGYADTLAGAPGRDDIAPDAGGVYLIPGAATPVSAEVGDVSPFLLAGQAAGTRLGSDALARPADVDGDAVVDVVAGSRSAGAVYVWLGVPSLSGVLPVGTAYSAFSGPAGSFAGSVALVDLDDDAIHELVVGSDASNAHGTATGELFVFRGGAGWGPTMGTGDARATVWGAVGEAVGSDAYGGFDADGDGRDDLLVGASAADGGGVSSGSVFLLSGW